MSDAALSVVPDARAIPLRFITAASLFDGHDASINIMRRMLQASGVEVVHLGHNRSVSEIVTAAIQEDAQGIAISSYQGGHVEYFKYMIDCLREQGAQHIAVFGGGGGVIVPEEISELHEYGVAHIYSPRDGQSMGLQGMIEHMIDTTRRLSAARLPPADSALDAVLEPQSQTFGQATHGPLARLLSALENEELTPAQQQSLRTAAAGLSRTAPVLGITGTGGSGKSSLTDELVRRLRLDQRDALSIAVLAIDPTRRKTGGALLGDRIRMNAIEHERLYMRSLATRTAAAEVPAALDDMVAACRLAGVDLIIVETPGIGQGDAGIVDISDVSLYVMTPEFGAASQLEKIDMLDFADIVAINKLERKGGDDALRDVRKQVQRNRAAFAQTPDEMPVFGTIAARFNDDGVTALYQALAEKLREHGLSLSDGALPRVSVRASTRQSAIIPSSAQRYLSDIAICLRDYHTQTSAQAELVREIQQLSAAAAMLHAASGSGEGAIVRPAQEEAAPAERRRAVDDASSHNAAMQHVDEAVPASLRALIDQRQAQLDADTRQLLRDWPATLEAYSADELVSQVRGREVRTGTHVTSLSGTRVSRVALPRYSDHGDLLAWLRRDNLPGHFPFTAGVFPFKRSGEDPTRMFAGEGGPRRTNRRFKALSEHAPAKRLSTAFDSVTLYGHDPARRPDIYGKVGNAGVSVATVDDMQDLYDGFDLCDPATSVSMTINGPAPTILAFYFVTALRQQLARFEAEQGRAANDSERQSIRRSTFQQVRGTVQADILKEDQGQNTCIFSTEFSLKMMADIQAWFIENEVRNFYSVSISGYHIAEAGANPITQLALTLSNGFTYVESYLARGMAIDDFAPNLSFFFSNGMDPEYTVMGRVARRIWAVAMRERYGANERSQKLKYHIQTSGRSLHAQEMAFNDIRTTLQALIAIYDNCNSLHTNAYDEAITTPTDASVRRAMAIQLVINREWGLACNENPNQGSFIIDELTDLVEQAVLQEFDRLSDRGGVLGAMETGYQRGRIQEESMLYEHRKHDGSLPIVGVNTFLNPQEEPPQTVELARSSDAEKEDQIARLEAFHAAHRERSPVALQRVRNSAMAGENVFSALMDAVEVCSLGQLTEVLFEVGGQYRRNL
ncbi:methylmalonyl-CoA mutase family protein [Granulosicoccus sp. 3-233]|uniref:methylmalonyl-CoA mutase family protein n=1 Tax=Granulosicoccus sp. 3-233 TaxID=3417969 RepID=UPI003D3549D7